MEACVLGEGLGLALVERKLQFSIKDNPARESAPAPSARGFSGTKTLFYIPGELLLVARLGFSPSSKTLAKKVSTRYSSPAPFPLGFSIEQHHQKIFLGVPFPTANDTSRYLLLIDLPSVYDNLAPPPQPPHPTKTGQNTIRPDDDLLHDNSILALYQA